MTEEKKRKYMPIIEETVSHSRFTSEDFDEVDQSWGKAEVTDFSGLSHVKPEKHVRKGALQKGGVPREAARQLERDIREAKKYRRLVYDKSELLQQRPFDQVHIYDDDWQSEARRLDKLGAVKIPQTLWKTPEDRARVRAKFEQHL